MSAKLPPGLQLEKVDERIMTLNVGPQHPGSGHMRIIVQIDGDYIVSTNSYDGDVRVTTFSDLPNGLYNFGNPVGNYIGGSCLDDNNNIMFITANLTSYGADYDQGIGVLDGITTGNILYELASADGFLQASDKTKLDNLIDEDPIPKGGIIISDYIPSGYLECDGSAVSRTTYSDLFSIIGTSFGIGDGSTTFNLPDLRGEFVQGGAPGTWQTDLVGTHRHGYRDRYFIEAYSHPNVVDGTEYHSGGPYQGTHSPDADNRYMYYYDTYTGYTGSETRPRNIALYYIIKY